VSYAYEVNIKVIFRAGALDEAYLHAQTMAAMVQREYGEPNLLAAIASAPMLDLKHRPDIDGSLKVKP
jgi:hypothetical protein